MKENSQNTVAGKELATTLEGDDVLHVIFILDRSGSMGGREDDVIGGVNAFVDGLRAEPDGAVGVSFVRFDNVVELVWNDMPLAGVSRMTRDDFVPRGSTALLDAVGMTVTSVVENADDRYHVIIHTDGEENSSREWTAARLRDLVKSYEAKGNWTFSFFGENIDAWADGERYGFAQGATASYTSAHKMDLFLANARVTNRMRATKVRSSKQYASASRMVMDNPALKDEDIDQMLAETPMAEPRPGGDEVTSA